MPFSTTDSRTTLKVIPALSDNLLLKVLFVVVVLKFCLRIEELSLDHTVGCLLEDTYLGL